MRAIALPDQVVRNSWYVLVALMAAAMGLGIAWSSEALHSQWLIMIVAGLVVLGLAVVSAQFERALLGLLIFAIPINPDINWQSAGMPTGAQEFGVSAMDLLLWILCALAITRSFSNRRGVSLKALLPPGTLWLLAIIGWGAVSTVYAYRPELGPMMLFTLAKCVLLYVYLATRVDSTENLRWLLSCLMVGLILEGLIAMAQHAAGSPLGLDIFGERQDPKEMALGADKISRVGGTLGHPNLFGGYLVSVLPVAYCLSLAKLPKVMWLLSLVASALGTVALILSFSRSAWLGMAMAILIIVGWLMVDRSRRARLKPILVAGALIGLLLIGFAPLIIARMTADDRGSTVSRFPQFRMAYNMIRSHPIVGVGTNNYTNVSYLYETYGANEKGGKMFIYYGRVHNIFLLTAAEMGIPSLFLLAGFVLAVGRRGWRAVHLTDDELIKFAGFGMLIGLAMRMFHDATHTGNLGNNTFLWVYGGLLIACSNKVANDRASVHAAEQRA